MDSLWRRCLCAPLATGRQHPRGDPYAGRRIACESARVCASNAEIIHCSSSFRGSSFGGRRTIPSPARETEERGQGAAKVRNTLRKTRRGVPTHRAARGGGPGANVPLGLAGNVDDAVVQRGRFGCEDGADEVGAEGEKEESDTPARSPPGLVRHGRDRRSCVGADVGRGDARGAVYGARGGSSRSATAGGVLKERARAGLT